MFVVASGQKPGASSGRLHSHQRRLNPLPPHDLAELVADIDELPRSANAMFTCELVSLQQES